VLASSWSSQAWILASISAPLRAVPPPPKVRPETARDKTLITGAAVQGEMRPVTR
jgi:hypothetical protein